MAAARPISHVEAKFELFRHEKFQSASLQRIIVGRIVKGFKEGTQRRME
jgi:hypothetical protein